MKKGLQVFGEENDMKKRIKVEKQPASKNKEIYGLFIYYIPNFNGCCHHIIFTK